MRVCKGERREREGRREGGRKREGCLKEREYQGEVIGSLPELHLSTVQVCVCIYNNFRACLCVCVCLYCGLEL